jgi:molybdenum cofactor cytidylyltransferase
MKTEALILAAGYSTRAGTYKMTAPINGKALIEHCVESFLNFCGSITVVTGFDAFRLAYLPRKYNKIELIHNSRYPEGMYSSVLLGLSRMKADRVFVTPGDYPAFQAETLNRMLQINSDIVIPAYHRKKGHPVLFHKAVISQILHSRYGNLHDFIEDYGFATVEVQDQGILLDADTPSDIEKLKGIMGQ